MNTSQVTQTSEIWYHLNEMKSQTQKSPKMSNLIISCPNCGSLEVFFKRERENSIMECLDCANIEKIPGWFD